MILWKVFHNLQMMSILNALTLTLSVKHLIRSTKIDENTENSFFRNFQKNYPKILPLEAW